MAAAARRIRQLREKSNPLFGSRKLKLGTFSTNLSGGCAISTIDGTLEATWDNTLELAQLADEMQFEALVPVGRWKGFGGVTDFNGQGFETFSWAAGIAGATRHSGIFATSHVPTVHPIMAAKQATTIDHISRGRFCLNVVTGWYKPEIEMFGAPQMSHDDRYDSAVEWLEIIKRLWTEDGEVNFDGRYYQVKGAVLAPKPLQQPYPVVMNAGGSEKGRHYAAKYCDVAFVILEAHDFDYLKKRVDHYRAFAREEYGRELLIWTYAYVVQGETEAEAKAYFDDYVYKKGDRAAVDNLVDTMGMNAQTLPPEALQAIKVHFMAGWGGFPLIGTREKVVEGLGMLAKAGFDGVLLSWPRYISDMRAFRDRTYPLLQQAGLR